MSRGLGQKICIGALIVVLSLVSPSSNAEDPSTASAAHEGPNGPRLSSGVSISDGLHALDGGLLGPSLLNRLEFQGRPLADWLKPIPTSERQFGPPNLSGLPIIRVADEGSFTHRLGEEIFVAPLTTDSDERLITFPSDLDLIDFWNQDIIYLGGTKTIDYSSTVGCQHKWDRLLMERFG